MTECSWPMLERHKFEFDGNRYEAVVWQEDSELAYDMLTEWSPFAFFYKMRNSRMPPHMEDHWRWGVVGPRWGERVEQLTKLYKASERLKDLCDEYEELAEEVENQWPTDHVGRALRDEFDTDDVGGLRSVLEMYVDKLSDILDAWRELSEAATSDLSVTPAVACYDACKFVAEDLHSLWACSDVPPAEDVGDGEPFRQVMTLGTSMADSLAALVMASYDGEGVSVLGENATKLVGTLDDLLYHPEYGMDNCTPLCADALKVVLSDDADVPLEGEDLAVWPLYCYQHGGLAMSTSKFSCGWDSGQVGWVAVSRTMYADAGWKEPIDQAAAEFAEMLGKFLDGGVYDYRVYKLDENGDWHDDQEDSPRDVVNPWEYMTAKDLAEMFVAEELRVKADKDRRSVTD